MLIGHLCRYVCMVDIECRWRVREAGTHLRKTAQAPGATWYLWLISPVARNWAVDDCGLGTQDSGL